MKPLKKPKIGLAGVMCTPFRGNKEENYLSHQAALEELALAYDFDFFAVSDGIYSAVQAAEAAKKLDDWGADFVILQASSFAGGDFIYPFAELSALLGIWAVPEGAPGPGGGLPLNSFTAANLYNSILRTNLTGYRKPVKWFFGNPGQPLFDERLRITVQALRALINLRGARIGLVGGVAPGFDNLIIDEQKLKERLGISVVKIAFEEALQRSQQVSVDAASSIASEIRSSAAEFDTGLEGALQKTGSTTVAMYDLADKYNLQALAISCWPRFQSENHLAVCTMMGYLNTQGLIAACEGDIPSAVSMLALRGLTNADVITLMDLVTVDPNDESVLFWHCGPTSPTLADHRGARLESLWLFDQPGRKPIGLHNDLVLKPGLATVLGFTTDFERMLIIDGQMDSAKPSYTGSRGWMKSLRLNQQSVSVPELIQTLMVSGFQHHYPFAYGSIADSGLELCAWLGISAISKEQYTPYVR